MSSNCLVLSQRYSNDSIKLRKAAETLGWDIWRFSAQNFPHALNNQKITIYCETSIAEFVAEKLQLTLLSPDDQILAELPFEFVKREIVFTRTAQFQPATVKKFIKPADYKYFSAGVYEPGETIPGFQSLYPDDPLLISDVVEFVDEYRLFVLDNQVITASTYMLNKEFVGDRSQGLALNEKSIRFAERVIQHIKDRMPKSYVLDIGKLSTGEYAVIEFNPSWGSGIYGADPTLALKVIKNAVQNNSKCSPDAPGT